MDKRTVLFVISLTLALFGIRIGFDYYNQDKKQEWLAEQAKRAEIEKQARLQEAKARTAKLTDLPFVAIAESSTAFGVVQDGWLLTVSSQPINWPEKITVTKSNAVYVLKEKRSDQLALYVDHPDAWIPLKCANLAHTGKFEIQFISLAKDKTVPQITVADFIDDKLTFVAEAPSGLAVGVVKVGSVYLPSLLYDPATKNQEFISAIPEFKEYIEKEKFGLFTPTSASKQQEYYVLENDYLQLVFSNIGGALSEINLPFKSQKDPKSAVLPIEIDREILEKSPRNGRFPLYPAKDASGKIKESALGGYYPLIRRNLIGDDGKALFVVPPRLYSCNIVSEFPELAELVYEVKQFSPTEIVLQASQPNRRITKTFTLPSDDVPYCFSLDIKIEGDSRGLSLTSGVPEIEWQSGASGASIKYRITRGKSNEVLKVDLPNKFFTLSTTYPDWICDSNGFFGIIVDPKKGNEAGFTVERLPSKDDPSRLSIIDPEYARFSEDETPGYMMLLPIKAGAMNAQLFTGPFGESVLDQVDDYFAKTQGTSPDFLSCQTYFGWFAFISEPFAKFMFFIMKLCYSFTHSWALSIVFVTIVLRLLLYPLNTWSIRSMKGMQEVGPQVKLIQEKYKKEPQRAQAEIIALYRSKGVNPLSGCLPLLLQIPFLIGMFDLLKTTFELRGAVFIPGWIDNLTSPDVLFTWKMHLPIIGNEFHLLPVILGGIMYVQQNVMSSLPKDPSTWTDQQRQQRMMGNVMTVVMTIMFYNFPSGLNIYWISSMLFGILQQWWITRSNDKLAEKAVVEVQVLPTHTPKHRHK